MENLKADVDIFEAYRYLGGAGEPCGRILTELQRAAALALECASPRVITRSFPLSRRNGLFLGDNTLALEGRSIAALLHDCDSCVLLCATIGNEIEQLLSRWQIKDITFAAMLDACASSVAECLCEAVSRNLYDEYSARGLHLTDRFSAGYGDFPLSVQKDFCAVLDTVRKIGVCVSEGGIMIPRKSVTAIIGVSENPQRHLDSGCTDCAMQHGCKFRESGVTCYGQAI